MDSKAFLKSFWQLWSVAKVFGLQALSLYFVPYCGGLIAETLGVRGCPPRPEMVGVQMAVVIMLSLLIVFVSIQLIIFPRVWLETINRAITFTQSDIRYTFFSTHPKYVLLDALLFIPAIALYWNGVSETMCEFNSAWGKGLTALIIVILFPALRLFCWFVLGRKIYAMEQKDVWMPIAWWYIFSLPVLIFVTYGFVKSDILPRVNTQIVTTESFVGGLAKHPEFEQGIVRVRGILKRPIGKCGLFGKAKDSNDYPFGTVVLDMGKGNGEIIVQAKTPETVKDLAVEAQNKPGQMFEAFGRLSKLPNPDKKMICGIENLSYEPPKGGRALLEIEMPK